MFPGDVKVEIENALDEPEKAKVTIKFYPSKLGPVQGTGHQLNDGGVHDVNGPFETEGELGAAVAAEAWLQGLQMFQHGPEELFGHFRIAGAVGVGERVFGRRRQWPRMQAQRVADVVEPQGVGELCIQEADDMAPGTERAGLIVHAGLPRQFGHQMERNEVANLPQQRELAGGWLVSCFHSPLP